MRVGTARMVGFALVATTIATVALVAGLERPRNIPAAPQANVEISPVTHTSTVGTLHALTAQVSINAGDGFANAPARTTIDFTILSGPGRLSKSFCLTVHASGSCSVTLTSVVPGVTLVQASATVPVGATSLTRTTGDGLPGDGDNARTTWVPTIPFSVPFWPMDKGFWSYYRYDDGAFAGGCLVIRESASWTTFWGVHTAGVSPSPSVPDVDFGRDSVLACILGFVRDCCASNVTIEAVAGDGANYEVSVRRTYQDGFLLAITNPYHLVRVAKTSGSVVFVDDSTGERIPQIPVQP